MAFSDRQSALQTFLPAPPILRPGETCWRKERAHRAGVLIDAEAYFRALRSAIIAARRSIIILAWELHTRVDLLPGDDPDDGWPKTLEALLRMVVKRRPELQVHVLLWDFSVIYAFERELVPTLRLPWKAHPRIQMMTDNAHPPGGSQHQKIVVIDDCLAFCGGLDVTSGRWDTNLHIADDPRRTTPDGRAYGPFHDVQMMVDGPAARALATIARERWIRAGGSPIPPVSRPEPCWPDHVRADFREVDIGIARTDPPFAARPAVREVEALYLAALAAARRHVYIENQYFTSATIGRAIEDSLQAEEGPEIVMVLPCRNTGWLEETTMGVGRSRLLRRLRRADRYGRFAVFNCELPGVALDEVKIHSKLMVIDDRLIRIGSSNLSNRSMGLDTECDLAIEADGRPEIANGILRVRDRLLAEHLDCEPEDVAAAVASSGSLIQAIRMLGVRPRRLGPFHDMVPELLDRLAPSTEVIDPDQPITAEKLAYRLLATEQDDPCRKGFRKDAERTHRGGWRRLFPSILLVAGIAGLAAAWTFTPLREIADIGSLLDWAETWRDSALAPVYVVLAFVAGGLIAFPVTLLISLTGALFPPFWGFLYALAGVLMSSILLFLMGSALGRRPLQRLGGRWLKRVSERLAQRGVLSVVIVRTVPVAPFSVVNFAAGAMHIRLRDFVLGTVLGMAPGTFALTVLGGQVAEVLQDPTPATIGGLAGAAILVTALAIGADRWLSQRRSG